LKEERGKNNMNNVNKSIPSVSVTYAQNGSANKPNILGMRPMQERQALMMSS